MINAAVITEAVRALLEVELPSEYRIERGEYVNTDYDRVPWVGVYRGPLKYDTATLGRGAKNWKAEFTVRIIVQAATNKGNANDAEDDLEEYLKAVLDAIMTDTTLSETVAMITGVNVTYTYNESDSESVYFQNAEIELLTEVRTS